MKTLICGTLFVAGFCAGIADASSYGWFVASKLFALVCFLGLYFLTYSEEG